MFFYYSLKLIFVYSITARRDRGEAGDQLSVFPALMDSLDVRFSVLKPGKSQANWNEFVTLGRGERGNSVF